VPAPDRSPGSRQCPSVRHPDHDPRFRVLTERPPSWLARATLLGLVALCIALVGWAAIGRTDIVAVAEGRLVPPLRVQIVQPAEPGIVREVLVREGERVAEGQALMRMDGTLHAADQRTLLAEAHARALALRRIDAELSGQPPVRDPTDPTEGFVRALAQYEANRRAHVAALAHERAVLARARSELATAAQVHAKLAQALPHYAAQDEAYRDLAARGFAGRLLASEKSREHIEKARDLAAQDAAVDAARAAIEQSERRLDSIAAEYRRGLHSERAEVAQRHAQVAEELRKLEHRGALQVLRAPHRGIVKDMATLAPGAVVTAGATLLSLVPDDTPPLAEVSVRNDDIGFVRAGLPVAVKLAAFPFQKYGLMAGRVETVGADAIDPSTHPAIRATEANPSTAPYRTLVRLQTAHLVHDGRDYPLASGMQVTAEIRLGDRTVLEYLLAPVTKAWREAARER